MFCEGTLYALNNIIVYSSGFGISYVSSIPMPNLVKVNGIIRSIYEYLQCIILAKHTNIYTIYIKTVKNLTVYVL